MNIQGPDNTRSKKIRRIVYATAALTGELAGTLVVLALTRPVASMLFSVSATDP